MAIFGDVFGSCITYIHTYILIMAALCNRGAIIFLPCGFFCQSGCLPYFHTWCGLSANLRCRSETCCTRLAGNTGPKNVAKNRHLGTIAQLCRAISSQLRHASTIGKKLVKQQYVLHMSPQYGELRPISGQDQLTSLGHPCKFQLVSHLCSITARQSSSGRQSNFVALNRGRHLYSAGWPSRWALAHILVALVELQTVWRPFGTDRPQQFLSSMTLPTVSARTSV